MGLTRQWNGLTDAEIIFGLCKLGMERNSCCPRLKTSLFGKVMDTGKQVVCLNPRIECHNRFQVWATICIVALLCNPLV